MSRTDLDHATLANALRGMAGDGSMEWVHEPIQASVLLDVADMLDENAELRELVRDLWQYIYIGTARDGQRLHDRTRELGIEVDE